MGLSEKNVIFGKKMEFSMRVPGRRNIPGFAGNATGRH